MARLIPKVFHRVWLGGKPMPAEFVAWGKSWLAHHPGWVMKLWTEKNLAVFKNRDLLAKCSCLGQQSDIVRYESLLYEGGVYLDTDMECVRNIEPLIQDATFLALRRDPRIASGETHSTAMFGATMWNPITADAVNSLRERFQPDQWTSVGPPHLSAILKRHPGEFLDLPSAVSLDINDGNRPAPKTTPDGVYVVNHHSSKWFAPSMDRLRPPALLPSALRAGSRLR